LEWPFVRLAWDQQNAGKQDRCAWFSTERSGPGIL
jgi:hypothetical protein